MIKFERPSSDTHGRTINNEKHYVMFGYVTLRYATLRYVTLCYILINSGYPTVLKDVYEAKQHFVLVSDRVWEKHFKYS